MILGAYPDVRDVEAKPATEISVNGKVGEGTKNCKGEEDR